MEEQAKKPLYKKWWFWVIIVGVLMVIGAAAGSDTPETSKTTLTSGDAQTTTQNTDSSNSSSSTVAKKSYKVGEVYEDRRIAIKYVSVNTNFKGYNQFATVKSGHKIIKADFEFENVGSSDFLASSYDFNCYADGYDCESFWLVDNSTFSSNLSSGKKAKGSVYFEVPKDANEITLEYEANFWTEQKVIFVVK